ncbi:glycosyltransferase family 4 protein [Mycolicibacterium obuense]|uniref:Glycosyl transferase n=1 Tax=Mycolicibacterium obuense TaxID=1807 RepID=A0A0M2K5J5_9MYCO|nr:glycosyltransferase family 4 protein [Mycolicibacterium obuense]KKF02488.1 glycosyl transferase [Mycolicibacterium obuense]
MKTTSFRNRAVQQPRVLIIVENLPSPFDRRVWQEATALYANGWVVSIICPTGKGFERTHELLEGIHIYRYKLPLEGDGPLSYLVEYFAAISHTFRLAWKVRKNHGFDVIHACNPPDLLFLVGGFFKLLFKSKFVFDHHDINPELFEAKFGKRGTLWRLMVLLERLSFKVADVSLATNESYRRIAIERGGMDPDKVYVVRSGPKLERLRAVPKNDDLKLGRRYLVGYVGVMGKQEGLDYLLKAVHYLVYRLGRSDIQFCLVGGGTSLEQLKQMAIALKVDEYVTFTGRVPDQQLLEVLNTADICVNPDVFNEMNDKSTMNKVMEYMALGKPIVQFDLAEGRFSAGESSVYASPNDPEDLAIQMASLLDNAQRRSAMGELGRARIENELEWKYEVPKLLAAYQALNIVHVR